MEEIVWFAGRLRGPPILLPALFSKKAFAVYLFIFYLFIIYSFLRESITFSFTDDECSPTFVLHGLRGCQIVDILVNAAR